MITMQTDKIREKNKIANASDKTFDDLTNSLIIMSAIICIIHLTESIESKNL